MAKPGRLFDQENKSVSSIGSDIWDGTEQPFSQFQKFSFWSVTTDTTVTVGCSHSVSQFTPNSPLHYQSVHMTANDSLSSPGLPHPVPESSHVLQSLLA